LNGEFAYHTISFKVPWNSAFEIQIRWINIMFTFHISKALLLYKSCTIIMQEGQIKEWIQRLAPVGCIIATAVG
jgi:hypothetical protein